MAPDDETVTLMTHVDRICFYALLILWLGFNLAYGMHANYLLRSTCALLGKELVVKQPASNFATRLGIEIFEKPPPRLKTVETNTLVAIEA